MPNTSTLVREFCAENLTNVPAALAAGAERIELCDNLAVGGTTPSLTVITGAVKLCHEHGAQVMCMIRPRGGDFVYSAIETQVMRGDLIAACKAGVDGVVFGCLRDGFVDCALVRELVALAEGLDVTFHMAFDALPAERQLEAIDWLAGAGVTRILTHGGPAGTPIGANIGRLREYVDRAAGRVAILPGGGVTWENAQRIAADLGVGEVHGTKVVRL